MDQDNNSGRMAIDEFDSYARIPTLTYSESEGRPWLVRAAAAELGRMSGRSESGCQAEGEEFALSPEELRIVELIVSGYTKKEIALYFSLSETAINRRTVLIINKLGVSNKLELVLFAISRRIVGRA
jgi:DNA-binding NarL/FixJ family response regulator